MTSRPTTVDTEIVLRLVMPGASALPVRATLVYDVADPYAVTVGFHTGSAETGESDVVEWTFARQLMTDGVTSSAGEGDVQVWPSTSSGQPVVCLSLSSPSGRALFEVPLTDLVDFLGRTYTAVPTGQESAYVDLDSELALLLWVEPES